MKQAASHRARSEDSGAAVHAVQRAVVLETQHERAVANQVILHDQLGHKKHIAALQRRQARVETVNAVREDPLTDTIEQKDSLTEEAALLALEMGKASWGKAVSLAQEEEAARLFDFISESAAVEAKAAARRQEMEEREADLVAREQAVERAAAEQQERQRAWTDSNSTRPPQVSF